MAIYKRPGKSSYYWTRFTFDGREIRQSTKTANKKKAEEYETNLKFQLNNRRIGIETLGNKSAKPIIFKDAMAVYLDNREVKESTKLRDVGASKALIAFFGNAVVSSIDTSDVERFRSWRKKQNKKAPARLLAKNPKARVDKQLRPATTNRELMVLSGFFKALLRSGKVQKNPVTGVDRLREDNLETRVVTDQEFRAYLMAASQPLRDVAVIMFETGMRPEEVYHLKKSDVDFQNRKIQIAEGKTDAARRKLTMSDDVFTILQSRLNTPIDIFFPGGKKGDSEKPIVKLTNAHLKAMERAKIIKPFKQYALRHTFATHLGASGVDLVTMTAIMGWSRIEMARRYVHPTEQHQADAFERLENFRNSQTNVKSFRQIA